MLALPRGLYADAVPKGPDTATPGSLGRWTLPFDPAALNGKSDVSPAHQIRGTPLEQSRTEESYP
jgi:hypothetical protein